MLLACSLFAIRVDAREAFTWQRDLEQAKREAAQTNRLVLVHFWAPWCGPCKRLEREVFSRPSVAEAVSANYVTVKVSVDDNRALAGTYGVRSIPADVILTPDGKVVKLLQSPATPDQYAGVMGQIAMSVRPRPSTQMVARNAPANPYAQQPPSVAMRPSMAQPRVGSPGSPYMPTTAPAPPMNSAPQHVANQQGQFPPQIAMTGRVPPLPPPPRPTDPRVTVEPRQRSLAGQPMMSQPAQPPPVAPSVPPATNMQAAPAAGVQRIALEGCCPVSIVDQVGVDGAQWVLGQPQFAATYQGQLFYFASEQARQRFLADPARYAPVTFGNDPVLAIDQGQMVAGNRTHALYFGNRMYLFANESTLTAFVNDRLRYSSAVMRQGGLPQTPPPNGRY